MITHQQPADQQTTDPWSSHTLELLAQAADAYGTFRDELHRVADDPTNADDDWQRLERECDALAQQAAHSAWIDRRGEA